MAQAFLVVLLVILVLTAILIWPLQWAARAMGAKRSGAIWCLLALLGANILQGLLGMVLPVAGNLVAFLLSAVAFAAILQTTFLRGIGIALLHLIFSVIIVLVLSAVFGMTLIGLSL
jgi:hypothetical protein